MPTNFLMLKKILAELKSKNSINVLGEYCQDEWEFYDLLMDLMNDEDFKQACIDTSFSKNFKKNLDRYIANQAKEAVSKYFKRKDIGLQAYYAEANDADRVLNINFTDYNRNEPIRISDILQQERSISSLNIYCDKRHDIYACRKSKERHYEFKDGARYEMISTWPATDESGKTFMCTMVMNISSGGITEILKFDGKDFESPSQEFWELIKQNEELYIQGLSLHDAVKALLEKNRNAPLPDVITIANNLQSNEYIEVNQPKRQSGLENAPLPDVITIANNLQSNKHIGINQPKRQSGLGNDAESSPIFSFIGNNVSTQTEVNLQQVATQVKFNSQPVATQREVSLQHTEAQVAVQHVETQTEISPQQIETQTEVDLREAAVQVKINSQPSDQKLAQAEREIRRLNEHRNNLQYELEMAKQTIIAQEKQVQNLQLEKSKIHEKSKERIEKLNEKLEEAKQNIEGLERRSGNLQSEFEEAKKKSVELEKHNSNLQNEFGKGRQENIELQAKLTQKDEELASVLAGLQEKTQELGSIHEEKEDLEKKLGVANVEKQELISELRRLQEELNQLQEKRSDLEDNLDQLERSNKGLEREKEQLLQKILDLEKELLSLQEVDQELSNKLSNSTARQMKSNQELIKARQEIEELEKRNNSLQAKHEKQEQKFKKEIGKIREKIIQINEEQEQKVQELYQENGELEERLRAAKAGRKKLEDGLEELKKERDQAEEFAEQVILEECQRKTHLKNSLLREVEELKNELKLKDEQIKKQGEQLRQEIEEEIINKYHPLLESKFEEYDDEVERLKEKIKKWEEISEELAQIIGNKVKKIEEVKGKLCDGTKETEDLNKQVEYLKYQIETLGTEISRLFANKQEMFNNRAKTFYTLIGNVDGSEKESRFSSLDGVSYSDDGSYDCHNLPPSFTSSLSKARSQSQSSDHSSIYP